MPANGRQDLIRCLRVKTFLCLMVKKIQYLTANITVSISYTAAFSLQFIGNLKKLVHFDACTNNINWIAPEIGSCCSLKDLTLSCNEIHVSVLEMLFILRVTVFWNVTHCHWANFFVLLDCLILDDKGTVSL